MMSYNTHVTHSRNRCHKSTAFFCHQFLVCVSFKFGTGFIWYQILVPIRTLFYSKPESGVHVTEMIIYDLFLFNLPLATIPAVIITTVLVNSSSMLLSDTFIFCTRNFHSRLESCMGMDGDGGITTVTAVIPVMGLDYVGPHGNSRDGYSIHGSTVVAVTELTV